MELDEVKRSLKVNFEGIYRIPEVISYIDEITSVKIFKYGRIVLKVYYRRTDEIDFDFMRKVLRRGAFILKTKDLTINLIPSPAKKIFEEDGIMSGRNINSGFTFISRNEIYIFRKEEYPKVILHELIHHDLNIHNDNFSQENKRRLMEHFKISEDTTLILNEAMIEMWATIFQLAFISIDYGLEFRRLYMMEMMYSMYKSSQIKKNQEEKKNGIWCDDCNIYAYIIFKTILLLNLNELIKIYMYPSRYDDTILTDFLIKHSYIPKIDKNPEYTIRIQGDLKEIKRPPSSLCFMLLSDL
jgi:hypothetical protein